MKGGEIKKKKLRKMGENNKRRDKYQVRRRQRQRERETMRWMDRNGKRMHGGGERRTEGLFCCLSISSCPFLPVQHALSSPAMQTLREKETERTMLLMIGISQRNLIFLPPLSLLSLHPPFTLSRGNPSAPQLPSLVQ